MEHLPRVLQRRRDALDLSRKDVIERLGELGHEVTVAAYGHWETGRRKPGPDHLAGLAQVLSFDADDCAVVLGVEAPSRELPKQGAA